MFCMIQARARNKCLIAGVSFRLLFLIDRGPPCTCMFCIIHGRAQDKSLVGMSFRLLFLPDRGPFLMGPCRGHEALYALPDRVCFMVALGDREAGINGAVLLVGMSFRLLFLIDRGPP